MKYCLALIAAHLIYSQVRVGEWDAYTSPLNIQDMVESGSKLVCATDGGILIYNRNSDEMSTLTKMHGLMNTNLAVIDLDPKGQFWIGGENPSGFIQIFDAHMELSETFDLNLTKIIDFAITDSLAFAAFQQNQDWGIMEFRYDGEQYFYKDVYKNWPVTLNNISGIVLHDDQIYTGTDQGMFSGNWKNTNLKDPANWIADSQLSGEITVFKKNQGVITLLMDRNIYEFDLIDQVSELQWDYYSSTTYTMNDMLKDAAGEYWGILSKTFLKLSATAVEWSKKPGESLNRILELIDGTIIAGTTTGLLFLNEDRTFTRKKPNCMLMNNVSALKMLADGRLVAGSKFGLMIKEQAGWRNIVGIDGDQTIIHDNNDFTAFVADTLPIHFGNYISDMEEGADGLLYCGIRGTYPEPRRHGGGILVIDIDNPANFTLIDTNHLDYFADEYLIVHDIEKDPSGNLWIADTYATTRFEPLKVLTADSLWGSFNVAQSGGVLSLTPITIDFDSWGRVWIGSFEDNNNVGGASNGGLAMLDYTGNPTDPDETDWKQVNVNADASTNTVWSLGINSQNILYTLSPKGLTGLTLRFSNDDPVSNYGYTYYPNIAFSSGSKLRIDPRDNVWLCSPTQGVYVLTSSATYWPDINGFTAGNSFLLSDNTSSIAFDEKNGLAYIGTDRGISVVKIPFANKKSTYKHVDVFPSPYRIPSVTPLTIDGLLDNSSCKIMTLSGTVIRTIPADYATNGYQAFWDGKDEKGKWVGTGVYLIAIYDGKGSSSFEKIAVIRN